MEVPYHLTSYQPPPRVDYEHQLRLALQLWFTTDIEARENSTRRHPSLIHPRLGKSTIMSNPLSVPISPADIDKLSSMISHVNLSGNTVRVAHSAAVTEMRFWERNLPIRPMSFQPASRLLSLPSELRLLICHHMYISPELGIDFTGAFYSCRQLQKDMLNELRPAFDLDNYVN